MQGLEFEIKGCSLIVRDLVNKGSLHIRCKPMGKPLVPPAYEAWNDIEHSIKEGKLNLQLFGFNSIKEQKGFFLEGDVNLSSSHLYDPTIFNSSLHMVSLKPRAVIRNSKLMFVGASHYGTVFFNECQLNSTPSEGMSNGYSKYNQNKLIRN